MKANELIAQIMGELFERELSLKPGMLLTITHVDTTTDLRYTRVFVSTFPEAETSYIMASLMHERKRLQKILHSKLTMKIRPSLSFILDTTQRHADIVEKLLKQVAEEESGL